MNGMVDNTVAVRSRADGSLFGLVDFEMMISAGLVSLMPQFKLKTPQFLLKPQIKPRRDFLKTLAPLR